MLHLARRRRLRHYLRLQYPVESTLTPEGFFFGRYPDLPGCDALAETPDALYRVLERKRRRWLETRCAERRSIPMPNHHLGFDDEVTVRELRVG